MFNLDWGMYKLVEEALSEVRRSKYASVVSLPYDLGDAFGGE